MNDCCNTSHTPGCPSDSGLSVSVLISTKAIEVQLDSLYVVLNDLQVALAGLCQDEGTYLQLISGVLSDIITADNACCNLLAGKLEHLKTTIRDSVNICGEYTTTTTVFSLFYPCGLYSIRNDSDVADTFYYRECGDTSWIGVDVNPGDSVENFACYEIMVYNPLLVVTLLGVCVPTTTTSTTEEPSTTTSEEPTTTTSEELSTTTTEVTPVTTEIPPLPDEIALDLCFLGINDVFDTALDYHLYIKNGTSNSYSTQGRVRNTTTGSWTVLINTFISYPHSIRDLTGTTAKLNYANTNGDSYLMEFSTDGGLTWTGITYNGTGTLPQDCLL
jgi:hypothetical protein